MRVLIFLVHFTLQSTNFKYDTHCLSGIVNNQRQTPPVSDGQEVDVQIESIGDKGDGVAKVKGFVIFVNGVTKGEWVRIKIKKVLASVAFAEKIKTIEPQERQERPQMQKPDAFADIDLEKLGEGSEDFGEEL